MGEPLLAPVLRLPGMTFVNLQYGDVAGEIAAVQDRLGVTIHRDTEIDPFTSASLTRMVGYVPQNITLIDDSIAFNVTFERPHDPARLELALRRAPRPALAQTQRIVEQQMLAQQRLVAFDRARVFAVLLHRAHSVSTGENPRQTQSDMLGFASLILTSSVSYGLRKERPC